MPKLSLLLAITLLLAVASSAEPICKSEATATETLFKPQRHDGCRLVVIKEIEKIRVVYDDNALVQRFTYFVTMSTGVRIMVSITEIDLNQTKKQQQNPMAVDPGKAHFFMLRAFYYWDYKKATFLDVYENGSGGYWIEVTTLLPPVERVHESYASQIIQKKYLDQNPKQGLLSILPY